MSGRLRDWPHDTFTHNPEALNCAEQRLRLMRKMILPNFILRANGVPYLNSRMISSDVSCEAN